MKRVELLMLALFTTATIAGQNKNAPVNYDESKVPAYEVPDVLKCEDGEDVQRTGIWRNTATCRR